MAALVPAVVGWVAAGGATAIGAAATAAMAGTVTLGTFATLATVAGGFLSTIGGLTKNQKLAKFGGYLSLAGGVGSIANSMINAGSAAAGEAAKAAADGVAEGVAGEAAKGGAAEGAASLFDAGAPVGGQVAGQAANATGTAANALGPPGEALAAGGGEALTMEAIQQQPTLMDKAKLMRSGDLSSVAGGDVAGIGQPNLGATPSAVPSKLAAAASEIQNPSHLENLLNRAGQAFGKVGKFVKDNKELVSVGGELLKGGMGAYQRQSEWEEQLNLMDQRRRRLNQPIALGQVAQTTVQPLPVMG